MRRKLAIGLALSVFAGTACWPFSDDGPLPDMTLEALAGGVRVERAGESITVDGDFSLQPGDVIATLEDGQAQLRLKGERQIELDSRSQVRVVNETTVEGRSGSLLAQVKEQLTVEFAGGAEARSDDATFRIDSGAASAVAATYRGDVMLTAPGERPLEIDRYFEAPVAARRLTSARPYDLESPDRWDLRFFDREAGLDEELTQLQRGFANQLGKQRPKVGFFRGLARGRRVAFMKDYLGAMQPADLVIGFTIGDSSSGLSLRDGVSRAYSLFEDGGSWGIIAGILKAKPRVVTAQIDKVIIATGASEEGNANVTFAASAGESASSGPATSPGGGGSTSNSPSDPKPPPDPKPEPKPTDEAEDCANQFECAQNDVNDLIPSPSPSQSP